MSAVYTFIHFKFVNTEFVEYQLAYARTKWEAAGMTEAQMDQFEKGTRMFSGPIVYAIATPIMAVIFGLICSLIIAAFLKRPATAAAGEAPPKLA